MKKNEKTKLEKSTKTFYLQNSFLNIPKISQKPYLDFFWLIIPFALTNVMLTCTIAILFIIADIQRMLNTKVLIWKLKLKLCYTRKMHIAFLIMKKHLIVLYFIERLYLLFKFAHNLMPCICSSLNKWFLNKMKYF